MKSMMKTFRPLAGAVAVFVAMLWASAASADPAIAGQAVIKVVSSGAARALTHRSSFTIVDSIPELQVYLVSFGKEYLVDSIVDGLKNAPNVIYAEPNTVRRLPNVQQVSIGFPDQDRPIFLKGVEPPSFYEQAGRYNIGLAAAQAMASGEGVTVAVLDNGLKFDHPLMLASSILPGYDFVDGDVDASEEEGFLQGHGTFVSGVVLLTAPQCTLLPVRVMSGDGVGNDFYIAKGLVWSVAHGADIANLSFGSEARSNLMAEVVAYAASHNVVMIVSAGNEATARPLYPAAFDAALAVGAIDTTELLANFSSFGPWVDLVAPGVNIYSAMAGDFEWGTWSGTSFSAPMVSGTAALILQLSPGLTPVQVRTQITRSARTELLWGQLESTDPRYGAGLLDVYEAVRTLSLGDIDGSGFTDLADLTILSNYIRMGQLPDANSASLVMADLDCNGKINMSDLTLLTAIVTGSRGTHRSKHCPQ